jgi:hypothetical protein
MCESQGKVRQIGNPIAQYSTFKLEDILQISSQTDAFWLKYWHSMLVFQVRISSRKKPTIYLKKIICPKYFMGLIL